MAVGAPPQPLQAERAARRRAVAFALVGLDAAAAERDRQRQRARPASQPRVALARLRTHQDRRNGALCMACQRVLARFALIPECSISRKVAGLWPYNALRDPEHDAEHPQDPDRRRRRRAARALVEQLALHEEFEAIAVDTGTKGVQAAKAGQIDLVIMDVGLPDMDGREAVRILRKNGFKAPIIMLTGHDTDSDTILGLESGANDYVTKPFRFAVLLARIRAQLRQHEASEDAVFAIGPYTFRPSSKLLLEPEGQQGPADRKGDRDPALSLSRRAEAGVARDAAAGSVGLQFRRHHPHAGNPHLPAAPEGREGCRQPAILVTEAGGYKLVP